MLKKSYKALVIGLLFGIHADVVHSEIVGALFNIISIICFLASIYLTFSKKHKKEVENA